MLCTAILLWRVVQTGTAAGEKHLTFTEFYKEVQSGNVESVTITNSVQVAGNFRSGSETLKTVLPSDYPDIINVLQENGVTIEVKESSTPAWLSFIINASPFLLLFGFWIFMMRQMQAGGNKALSFGKSAPGC